MKKTKSLLLVVFIAGFLFSVSTQNVLAFIKSNPFISQSSNNINVKGRILQSDNNLKSVSVTNYPEVYTEIDHSTKKVLLIIPYKSTLKLDRVPLFLSVDSNATSNLRPGKKYNLTKSFTFTIIGTDKSTTSYTIIASKCDGSKSALIISDTQNDIIPLYRQDKFFKNVNSIQKKAFEAGVPIYYIMLSGLKGSSKWDLPPQLTQYKTGIIVDKPNTVDAFEVESFTVELLKKGIGKVYVIGVSSMGCVKGTGEGALKKKFDLVLVSDAHSEPIGYRDENAIDDCNEIFRKMQNVTLLSTKDVDFN